MAQARIREALASVNLPAPLRALGAPLGALVLAALPVAGVAAGISSLGLDETRYTPAPPPADDAPAWVVARTDGTLAGGCQIAVQVFDDAARASPADATLRLVRATARGAADVWTATTNARGAHRFASLPKGTYHLAAFDGDRAPAAAPTVVCAQDGARVFASLAFSDAAHVLRGTVTSADRKPIAGAELALEQELGDRAALPGVLRVPVGNDGAFTVKLAPGRYTAQLTAPHHAPQLRKITIEADAPEATLVARLQPAPEVEGVVVDEQGAPLADALVSLGGALDPKARAARVRTDADGRFVLPVQMGQHVAVTARAGDRVARAFLGEITQPLGLSGVTLVAHAGRTVLGQVTRADGNPHAYGEVRFRVRELGLTGVERADGEGRFALAGMPLDADVEVWAEGNATGAWGAQVASPGNDQLALVYVAPAW